MFPETGRMKSFVSLTHPHSRMCIRIYIFIYFFFKEEQKQKQKKAKTKKAKDTIEERKYLWKI